MNIDYIQIGIALCVGLSLSASCGFRVFIPLLVMALSVRFCGLSIDENLAWVGSDAALICLGAATIVEILAYYIPVVDNFLDTIVGPAALVAGALVTGGMLGDLPDWLQWGVGIVAGAGTAGTVQLGTSAVRAASTATSAGMGNPIVSTAENGLSIVGAIMAVLAPLLAIVGAALFIFLTIIFLRKVRAFLAAKKAQKAQKAAAAAAA